MKKIFIMLLVLSFIHIAHAETLAPDQIAVKTLIKNMYAFDSDVFESATFGTTYKNGEEVVPGKYDPLRQCRLLAEFLVKEAVIKEKGTNQPCMTGVDGYFRYPGLDGEDLFPATRLAPLPKPFIHTPAIKDSLAKVYVTFPNSGKNIFYYLRKVPEGWRIYRIESRVNENWRSQIQEIRERDDIVDVFPPEKSHK